MATSAWTQLKKWVRSSMWVRWACPWTHGPTHFSNSNYTLSVLYTRFVFKFHGYKGPQYLLIRRAN